MGSVVASPERWQPAAAWSPREDALDLWRVRLLPRPGDRALLSEGEQARARRLVVAAKREQMVAARAALRRILGRYLDEAPERVELDYGEHGKPFLAAPNPERLQFNLSHSRDVGLIGLAGGNLLGVDVEHRRAGRPLERMARRFFSAAEYAQYATLGEAEKLEAFYRLWCRKEAYLKAWGTGLTFSSRRFTVAVAPSEEPWLRTTEMAGDEPSGWCVSDLEPWPGFAAAVCWRAVCWRGGRQDLALRLFTLA